MRPGVLALVAMGMWVLVGIGCESTPTDVTDIGEGSVDESALAAEDEKAHQPIVRTKTEDGTELEFYDLNGTIVAVLQAQGEIPDLDGEAAADPVSLFSALTRGSDVPDALRTAELTRKRSRREETTESGVLGTAGWDSQNLYPAYDPGSKVGAYSPTLWGAYACSNNWSGPKYCGPFRTGSARIGYYGADTMRTLVQFYRAAHLWSSIQVVLWRFDGCAGKEVIFKRWISKGTLYGAYIYPAWTGFCANNMLVTEIRYANGDGYNLSVKTD